MSRRARIFRNIAIGLAAFFVVVVAAVLMVSRTQWFRDFVKQKIIAAAEDGTGGRAEIGSFTFDPLHLRAMITGFVIHGNEPACAAPYLSARRAEVDVRLLTSIHHVLSVAYLGLDNLRANIMVFADGTTNVPTPKTKSQSNETPLESVVDLAVGHFDLTNGLVTYNSVPQPPLNIRANNLRVQLAYNALKQHYQGSIFLEPLYVANGHNTPVNFSVLLPVTVERDRISFQNARIASERSEVLVNGAVENLRNLKTSVHINGHLALADVKNAGNLPLELNAREVPAAIQIDANAAVADNAIQVKGLKVGLGHSRIEASGTLKDPAGNGSLDFKAQLALSELGRLAGVAANPQGTVALNGKAKLDAANRYQVVGNLAARDVSVQQGERRIGGINLFTAFHLDPPRLNLDGATLIGLGGEIKGNASLEEFARFQVDANLRRLDLAAAARTMGQNLPYDGTVSGPIFAQGDLRIPGTKSMAARVRLAIAPGRRGIPVSGRLVAAYNGATDNIDVSDSFLALPHTRVTLSGSIGNRLNVGVNSRHLHDLLAAVPGARPVSLDGGQLNLTAAVSGRLSTPRINGHLAMDRFRVEERRFDTVGADFQAASTGAAVANGSLGRGAMLAQFHGSVGMRDWQPLPNQPISLQASVRGGDLADVMALAGQVSSGFTGTLTADANISGTVGNPRGTAGLQIVNGTVENEPFDRLQAQVNLADQLITVPSASISSGTGRVDLTTEFHHPRDSFASGQLHAHLQSNALNLAQLRTVQQKQPGTGGQLQVDADVAGDLANSAFVLSQVNGNVSGHGLRFQGQDFGDLGASARTSGKTVTYNLTSDFAGSSVRVNGNTELAAGYRTTASMEIARLPIERVLAAAKQNVPAKGTLSGTARVTGTLENPEGSVDLDLASAVVYDEPLDDVRARVTYAANRVDVPQLEIVSGPSRIDLTARYDHAPKTLDAGDLQFHVSSSHLDLGRIRNVQQVRPGLAGALTLTANGSASLRSSGTPVVIHDLDADVAAKGIAAAGKNLADLTLTAKTNNGRVDFALDSDLAGAAIHGNGNAQLSGDYPVNAKLTFDEVGWTRLQPLLGANGVPSDVEAVASGQVEVNGPLSNTNDLRGSLSLTQLQIQPSAAPTSANRRVVIQNQGPISIVLDRGVARIQSVHLAGGQTDIQATGSFALQTQAISGNVKANCDLGILQKLSREIVSSGSVAITADVRGTASKPLVNGRLELHNAAANSIEISNGISNANGVVQFNGSSASMQNVTAEVGGGKVTLGGYAAYRDVLRFGMHANASNVLVRLQPGVSALADANVQIAGNMQASRVTGMVTIDQITYAPTSDFGAILARAAPPVQNASEPSPLLDNMKLDLTVRTSPSLIVQTSMAENLQLDGNLQIRGSASQPGVLGRISITDGQLLFFSSTYTVNSGTISFYNPVRIEPILNLSLETKSQGVNVTLKVTGPIDNMNLSYTSDPPLQFQEIVGLLAAGKTPTSDPNVLVNQPAAAPQTFQQMGESAIVSQAIASPVAGRLQRVFGVSQLSIDPTFASGSDLPEAQLSLKQRISSNMTFTYVTAVNDPNTQIIQVEWALNPQWSAIAGRDQNGLVSVRFLYKKQFR
jgi:translocation and assembly module TamB